MKLHRIKQTSGRHDELSLGGVSLVLFARAYRWYRCWSVIFPRSEFSGYAREKGYSPCSPFHTPISSECYSTTYVSRVPSSLLRRRRIVDPVSCSFYHRELYLNCVLYFRSCLRLRCTIIPNSHWGLRKQTLDRIIALLLFHRPRKNQEVHARAQRIQGGFLPSHNLILLPDTSGLNSLSLRVKVSNRPHRSTP